MQRVIHRHADQAGAQHQGHHMHMPKQRHTSDGAKQHAHQHRHKGQQHPPASEGQQQQQQDADGCATADPGDFPRGLLLPIGRIEQAAGGEQLRAVLASLLAAGLEQIRHLQRQFHIEGIAVGACRAA